MELIPPELYEAVGSILTFGAKKYDDRNWEKGMKWSRVYGALLRHLTAWDKGEEKDPETGRSHLWHAGCCIAFLITYEMRGIGEDDRSKRKHPIITGHVYDSPGVHPIQLLYDEIERQYE